MAHLDSNTVLLLGAAAIILALVLAIGLIFYIRQRRLENAMRGRFGPEYDRLVNETGSRKLAQSQLTELEKRVAAYDIHRLRPDDRTRYVELWRNVQAAFVDNPRGAVSRADEVLTDVMADRGYPMSDFDGRSADLSVDHPVVVQNYRTAHDIVLRQREGNASTEDLRQAMIHYKSLFNELVTNDATAATAAE